jgi:hypothetical protein
MSTRSLTLIYDDKGAELLNIYRHSDGYPSGHGQELARFLSGFQIVNGLRYEGGKIANGIGCLAAQLVAHLKDEPGQIYIYPIGKRNVWEDYVYEIRPTGSGIRKEKCCLTALLNVSMPTRSRTRSKRTLHRDPPRPTRLPADAGLRMC